MDAELTPEFSEKSPRSYLMGKDWGWVLATGIASVVLGLVAFGWPIASTLALTLTLGFLLVANGVIQAMHAIQLRRYSGTGWRVLQSVVALAAGALILRYPGSGMLAVTISLAFFFFVGAASKWIIAAGIRPTQGWAWIFVSSLVSLALGIYVVATFPVSALWLPGALLGADLTVAGLSLIGFSFTLRDLYNKFQASGGRFPKMRRVA